MRRVPCGVGGFPPGSSQSLGRRHPVTKVRTKIDPWHDICVAETYVLAPKLARGLGSFQKQIDQPILRLAHQKILRFELLVLECGCVNHVGQENPDQGHKTLTKLRKFLSDTLGHLVSFANFVARHPQFQGLVNVLFEHHSNIGKIFSDRCSKIMFRILEKVRLPHSEFFNLWNVSNSHSGLRALEARRYDRCCLQRSWGWPTLCTGRFQTITYKNKKQASAP